MPACNTLLTNAVTGPPMAAPSAPILSDGVNTLPVAATLATALVPSVTALVSATAMGLSSVMAIRKNFAGPVLVSVLAPSINDT